MLLQPFLGVLIVLHRLTWAVLPALAAVVLVFALRDPLTVIARQRWVWRTAHPETAPARRYLLMELALLLAAGAWLLLVWPAKVLAILGAGAAALTALAVYMTVKNRQRSLWLQALSAAGLSSSGVAACLAITGTIPAWAWWWCGLHCAHFLASILVVHARLEARIAARKGAEVLTAGFLALRRQAVAVEIILISTAVWLLISGQIFYAAALLLSEGMHAYDLARLHTASAIAMPMTRVGLRALAVSIAFTGLAIAGALTA